MMNFRILFFLFLPYFFSAQQLPHDSNDGQVTFIYEAITVPSSGVGVVGTKSKRAFASFVDPKLPESDLLIFNEIIFQTVNFNKNKSTVYLCLYVNDNGKPGSILPGGKILVETPAKKTFVTTNISKLKIPLPANGYFIGFEWIPTKENTINGAQTTSNKPFNPTISGMSSHLRNLFVFDGTWKKAADQFVSQLNIEVSYKRLSE